MVQSKVVSETEWLAARKQLLDEEKEFTRLRDQLSQTPRSPLGKSRILHLRRPQRRETLADLFRGKSQLIVYHFMFGPDWTEGCPSCSFISAIISAAAWCISRRSRRRVYGYFARAHALKSPLSRNAWVGVFKWASSNANSFNFDYHVSFTPKDKVDGNLVNYNYRHDPIP